MSPSLSRIGIYVALTRLDRPIGSLLLLWPTLTALWLASGGVPSLELLVIFTLGTFLTRSAGCVVNDFADRNLDGAVTRTRERPLVTHSVSDNEAIVLSAVLAFIAFVLVLFTNTLTILLSFVGAAIACCYPFMKRLTHLPQLVLGVAFSWGILMAFAAAADTLPASAWLLFIANVLWTVAYDTQYAMVDREDDLKVGIKSTAILFGSLDRAMIAALQLLTLLTLVLVGRQFSLGNSFDLALLTVAGLFGWQHWQIRERDPRACFRAFLNNNYVGLVIFAGVVLHYLQHANS
jgi:4-hydroxybenzoate polyprenyltransferase